MVNPFKQPYHDTHTRKQKLIFCLAVGFFIFLFNFFLKPLDFSRYEPFLQIVLSLSFGIITSLILLFFKFLLEPIVITERWTLGKNLVWEIFIISWIGVAGYFYVYLIFHLHFYLKHLLLAIGYALLIGTIPSTIKHLIVFNRMYRNVLKEAYVPEEEIFREDEVSIRAGNPKNHLKLNSKKIIYLCSNDNYVTIVTLRGDTLHKATIRGTLKGAESELRRNNRFLRCHKCYIVNADYIDKVIGKNQNMTIRLLFVGKEIPVSRTKAGLIIKKFNKV